MLTAEVVGVGAGTLFVLVTFGAAILLEARHRRAKRLSAMRDGELEAVSRLRNRF